MTKAEKFDLIVIGSGPAGEKGAAQAAYFGKKVAVVEKEPVLGGAAANTGTLPSKTLRETALFLSGFRNRELFGLDVRLKKQLNVRDFMARERLVKENERSRIQANLRKHKIALFMGSARFNDEHTVGVRPNRCAEFPIQAETILIATGSYPFRPVDYPFHDSRVYDSDTILNLHEIPKSMLVVGGGVIGCEYACMFAALGVKVVVVEKRNRLVGGFLDHEIADALRREMEAMDVRLFLEDSVDEMRLRETIEVDLGSGAELEVDTILVSSGRCGQVEDLNLEKIGLMVGERGRIPVNEHYQTNLPHIYAAGDVIGGPALASTSMEQARTAICHAFNLGERPGVASILPYGIYTVPECSMAGETEETLASKGIPHVAGRAYYRENARGQIIGDSSGFLKLLFHEDDMRLLGVHVIGEQAAELVHLGLMGLQLELRADFFVHTCFNYPTLAEVYKYAAYDALGRRDLRRAGRSESPPPP